MCSRHSLALFFSLIIQVDLSNSAPVSITQGGWYMDSYSSDDPAVPAVNILTQAPVTIYHSLVTAAGVGIQCVSGAQVTVLSCYGISEQPGQGIFVQAQNPTNFQVNNCFIANWRIGIWLANPPGSPAQANVTIMFNVASNNLQFAQLVDINGVSGAIAWNQDITDIPCTDQINIYGTCGRTPFLINDNYIYGPVGTSTQGGIVMDGVPGTLVSSNISINQNQVIGANFNGITLAYSHNCSAANNTVLTAGPVTWYGMQAYLCDATNVIGPGNLVGFGQNAQNYLAYPGWGTYSANLNYGPVTASDQQLQYAIWQNKLAANGIVIGPIW
jgi:hypothetical protein